VAGRYRLSQEGPQPVDLSTLGSGAIRPNHGRESRTILVRGTETPPPAVVAGISHFRPKGRDNLKLPQFLEIVWHMESTGIQGSSSAQLSMAEICAGLASARFSACPPQISSSTGQCLKQAERKRTGHTGAANLPSPGELYFHAPVEAQS